MITINLFTSGQHSQPLIEALRRAKNIKLVNISSRLPYFPDLPDKPDVFIVADFGQIIPKKILKIPKYSSLGVHPSLLPKYRGASPVQSAIMNGEKETGVTIFKMDEKVDHGPIIAQFKEEIGDDDTAESLYARLFAAGGQILVTILAAWIKYKTQNAKRKTQNYSVKLKTYLTPKSQNHNEATYTKTLTRQDGFVSTKELNQALEGKPKSQAVEIERKIRAFHPWPGAWTKVQFTTHLPAGKADNSQLTTKRLKLLKAHFEKSPTTKLVLDEIQLEGKKPVSWKQFVEGYPGVEI